MALKLIKVSNNLSPSAVVDAMTSFGTGGFITIQEAGTAVAGNWSTLLDYNGAAYQVTAGKVLYLTSIWVMAIAATGGIANFGFGDTSVSNGVAPTNVKNIFLGFIPPIICTWYQIPGVHKIPATKYPAVKVVGATINMFCEGFEE